MNTGRMSTLITHLEKNVKEHEFNIANWKDCAIGHAANIEEFNKDGFRLVTAPDVYGTYPVYKGDVCFAAIQRYFRISSEDALKLFYDQTHRRTLSDEIDILRHHLACHLVSQETKEFVEVECYGV